MRSWICRTMSVDTRLRRTGWKRLAPCVVTEAPRTAGLTSNPHSSIRGLRQARQEGRARNCHHITICATLDAVCVRAVPQEGLPMSVLEQLTPPKEGQRIEIKDGRLSVPNQPIVPFIEGDGTGPDIWRASKRIFDAAVSAAYSGQRKIVWFEVFAGEKAHRAFGTWLPEDTLRAFQHYVVGIKGPLTTPVGGGFRSLNVALRQKLDLYACVRPVRWFEGVPSPVKAPQDVNMIIFRENTEDIYAGIEYKAKSDEARRVIDFLQQQMGAQTIRFPATSAIGIKPVSEEGSKRLIRSAVEYAIAQRAPSLTLVHKGNIMKFTEGGFR